MSYGCPSLVLYDPSDPDLSQALLRCSDLLGFLCQAFYPGCDPAGHYANPDLMHIDPPATLLWWLCSLRATLEQLYLTLSTSPPEPLQMALQAYLAEHREQETALRQVLVAALERDFAQWDSVRMSMALSAFSGDLSSNGM